MKFAISRSRRNLWGRSRFVSNAAEMKSFDSWEAWSSLGTDIGLITVTTSGGEGSFPCDKRKYLSHPRGKDGCFVVVIRPGWNPSLQWNTLCPSGGGPATTIPFPKGNGQGILSTDDTRREGKVVSRLRRADKDHHHRSFGLS